MITMKNTNYAQKYVNTKNTVVGSHASSDISIGIISDIMVR